ncbi:hypothetical protein EMIT093MI4_170010 [Pseudomonas sp. IT-93MI4]
MLRRAQPETVTGESVTVLYLAYGGG